MAYVILELQTDEAGATATPPLQTRADLNVAKSVFHQVSASAAVSSVAVHTVVLMDETGNVIKKETTVHSET